MRPDFIDITIAKDTGSMNRLPKSIPVERNTKKEICYESEKRG
jgi:hypothetical protein